MITKHRISTYSGLLIAGFLALSTFVLYGLMLFSIYKQEERVHALALALASKTMTQKDQVALAKTIDTIRDQRTALNAHFVSADETAHFLETLESYGKIANTTFALLDATTDKDQKTILISFKAQGAFADIYKLISLIENAPYVLAIEKATFAVTDKVPARPTLSSTSSVIAHDQSGSSDGTAWEGNFTVRLISFISKK